MCENPSHNCETILEDAIVVLVEDPWKFGGFLPPNKLNLWRPYGFFSCGYWFFSCRLCYAAPQPVIVEPKTFLWLIPMCLFVHSGMQFSVLGCRLRASFRSAWGKLGWVEVVGGHASPSFIYSSLDRCDVHIIVIITVLIVESCSINFLLLNVLFTLTVFIVTILKAMCFLGFVLHIYLFKNTVFW